MNLIDRREFVAMSAAGTALLAGMAGPNPSRPKRSICAFVKFIQKLSFDDLADQVADLGFQGIEATVRPGGLVEPERVRQQLPQLMEALNKRDLEVTVMTTSISNIARELDQQVLKTAADLGVKRFRMGYYRYDLKRPILPQLETFRPRIESLAKFNRDLGMTAVYQNHAGARNVGSTIWDLEKLLRDIDPEEVGVAFDIRHAVVAGGTSWPILWDIIQSKVQAIYAKDFIWQENRIQNVPLGEGMVPEAFFQSIPEQHADKPISVHVEYLGREGTEKNVEALGVDLRRLKTWL